jgi:hypothetical protein
MEQLPIEILAQIVDYLDCQDHLRLACVNSFYTKTVFQVARSLTLKGRADGNIEEILQKYSALTSLTIYVTMPDPQSLAHLTGLRVFRLYECDWSGGQNIWQQPDKFFSRINDLVTLISTWPLERLYLGENSGFESALVKTAAALPTLEYLENKIYASRLTALRSKMPNLRCLNCKIRSPVADKTQLDHQLAQFRHLKDLTLTVESLADVPDVAPCQLDRFKLKVDCCHLRDLSVIQSIPVTVLTLKYYSHSFQALHHLKGHPTLRRIKFKAVRKPTYDIRIAQADKKKIHQQYDGEMLRDFEPIHRESVWVEYEKISGRPIEQLYWKFKP